MRASFFERYCILLELPAQPPSPLHGKPAAAAWAPPFLSRLPVLKLSALNRSPARTAVCPHSLTDLLYLFLSGSLSRGDQIDLEWLVFLVVYRRFVQVFQLFRLLFRYT
jgi:hypothetical protein